MSPETIAIAVDHGGFNLKAAAIEAARNQGCNVLDLGTDGTDSVDYPDFAEKLVQALADGRASRGILICGTGIGISIAANRHSGIRAALCYDDETATLARQHNDANVLCLGGRKTDEASARSMVKIFLTTAFEGGRHARRIAKLG
jgi:ribose 5-phosphate isomerase B